jgi:hypothetical protein
MERDRCRAGFAAGRDRWSKNTSAGSSSHVLLDELNMVLFEGIFFIVLSSQKKQNARSDGPSMRLSYHGQVAGNYEVTVLNIPSPSQFSSLCKVAYPLLLSRLGI